MPSVLFTTACGVFRKMFSTFYYKVPLIDGESEKVGLFLKSCNLRCGIKRFVVLSFITYISQNAFKFRKSVSTDLKKAGSHEKAV